MFVHVDHQIQSEIEPMDSFAMQPPEQRAQVGLQQIEEAILALLEQHPEGLTNAEVARSLGIETGEAGEHRNMLSWSIIGRLIGSARVERAKLGRRVILRRKG
jgi:hypothetical protein